MHLPQPNNSPEEGSVASAGWQGQPEWIRLPKSGTTCPHTGLTRSALNALILGPKAPVKSVSLRKRYTIRGIRLIHLPSLLAYIESHVSKVDT